MLLLYFALNLLIMKWPLFTYELILGQHIRKGFMDAWSTVHPRWRGFGWAQLMLIFIVQSYFSVVIAYTLPYIKGSCQSPLPWTAVGTVEYWEEVVLGKLPYPDLIKGLGGYEGEMAIALTVFWVINFFSVSVAFGKNVLSKITYVTGMSHLCVMIMWMI